MTVQLLQFYRFASASMTSVLASSTGAIRGGARSGAGACIALCIAAAFALAGCVATAPAPAPSIPPARGATPVAPDAEPPPPNVNLSGFPLPYRQGYADGCASAGGRERKDAARFASDGNYRTGWQDGVALCKKK